jgi:hypothetical protein
VLSLPTVAFVHFYGKAPAFLRAFVGEPSSGTNAHNACNRITKEDPCLALQHVAQLTLQRNMREAGEREIFIEGNGLLRPL